MPYSPSYLFRFDHLKIEIPYTDIIINIYSPWSYIISIGSCFLYLLLITTIFPLYKSKFNNKFALIHHALLFIYSLVSFLAALVYIIQNDEITNLSDYMCVPISPWLRVVSITFTLSKIWEWLDTAILIGKGHSFSKIGFLHIYHHATTFLLLLNVMNFPGAEKSGMLMNGFVHTLMYYHFAFRLPKLLRPLITTLQIIQLMAVTYIWHVTPSVCPAYEDFPRRNWIEFLIPYAIVPVYCLFFFKFFFEQYLLSPSKTSKSSSRKEE